MDYARVYAEFVADRLTKPAALTRFERHHGQRDQAQRRGRRGQDQEGIFMTTDIRIFGQRLIETGDLDPVYIALHGANLHESQLCRWITAYLMFYHVGSASWLSERTGEDYWKWVRIAAANVETPPAVGYTRWPRSSERRHFRGDKCVAAVDAMQAMVGDKPEALIRRFNTNQETEKTVIDYVRHRWPLHGPWAGFKLADLLERVMRYPIHFSPHTGLLYDSPRKALDDLVQRHGGTPQEHHEALLKHFASWSAPPRYERPCGPQEVETILCKWRSSLGGHYHVGKDIAEVRHALANWGKTAGWLLDAAPMGVSHD